MFCHLAAHSSYSFLEGVASPQELAQTAARLGLPGLFLTDHLWLTGAVEFWSSCLSAGIKPGLGLELDLVQAGDRARVQLLATSRAGWSSLCRLSSRSFLGSGEKAGLPPHTLLEEQEGLLLIVPNEPLIHRLLPQLAVDWRGRVYAGLNVLIRADIPAAEEWARVAKGQDIPAVASHPVHYLVPEQEEVQRLLSAIRLVKPVTRLAPHEVAPKGAWFLGEGEMRQRYGSIPGALEHSLEILARCDADLPLGQSWFPRLEIPDGLAPIQYLRREAEAGAIRRYGRITAEIQQRLDHELEIIAARGYEPIFLIVKELLDFAQRNDIPTASRGSASSSLVAHCLGITTPDPLALDLYFERFLNPARRSPPDIDTDICSKGRDKVIQHAFERFGQEQVAMVATINRFRPRSALSDTAKAFGLGAEEIRQISAKLPHSFWARAETEENASGGYVTVFQEAGAAFPQHRAVLRQAAAILGLPRHLSIHPGGLVVCPAPVTERVPLMHSETKGIRVTQMDLHSVEALGLVKMDLLGIRGLSVMGDVAHSIQSWRRMEFRSALDVLNRIPAEDDPTATNVANGRTIGCFQIESPGMRGTLREIKAQTARDILAALALFRPGPLQGGLRDAFVRRFKGVEAAEQLHPSLEPLLGETYGVILYQEQVLRIANEIAGFSMAEADLLRRAMSHFDPGKQMTELRQKFLAGAEERAHIPRETAERLWELMAAFAGYGFPKAHAASYAEVGWRSAWCKTHFPAEFMAAVLANWGGYYSQSVYLSEARRLKLRVESPDVLHSRQEFHVAYPGGDPVLYMGLGQVKHLSHATLTRIVAQRPFSGGEDFLRRVDPGRKELDNLIRSGCLRQFGPIPAMLRLAERKPPRAAQAGFFDQPGFHEQEPNLQTGEDWTAEAKCAAQIEILGAPVTVHPLELVAEKIPPRCTPSSEIAGMIGNRVTIAGVRMASRRTRTAKGETMLFLTAEDLDGTVDCVFFPDVYRRQGYRLDLSKPFVLEGIVEREEDREDPTLRVERATNLS